MNCFVTFTFSPCSSYSDSLQWQLFTIIQHYLYEWPSFFFFCCVYLCVCALLSIVFDFFRLRRLVELGQEAINAVSGLSPSGPGSFCLEWS